MNLPEFSQLLSAAESPTILLEGRRKISATNEDLARRFPS